MSHKRLAASLILCFVLCVGGWLIIAILQEHSRGDVATANPFNTHGVQNTVHTTSTLQGRRVLRKGTIQGLELNLKDCKNWSVVGVGEEEYTGLAMNVAEGTLKRLQDRGIDEGVKYVLYELRAWRGERMDFIEEDPRLDEMSIDEILESEGVGFADAFVQLLEHEAYGVRGGNQVLVISFQHCACLYIEAFEQFGRNVQNGGDDFQRALWKYLVMLYES